MTQKIRMTLLIDERSHPELYADLNSIVGDRFRTERVRYLAAMGLVLSGRAQAMQPQAWAVDVPPGPSGNAAAAAPAATAAAAPGQPAHGSAPPHPADARAGPFTPNTGSPPGPMNPANRSDTTLSVAAATAPNTSAEPVVTSGAQEHDSPAARAARTLAQSGLFGRPSNKANNS